MPSPTLHGAPPRFERGLREVASNVWAWLQPNGDWGEANAGLIRGVTSSVVVDTLWDQHLAREMLDAMAPHVEGAPVRLAINTHSDGDHFWGNAELPPDVEILTSAASLRTMEDEASPVELRRLGAMGRRTAFLPGPFGAMGRYVGDMLAPFALGDVELRVPDRTFSGRLTQDVGGREVRLIEVGPAHTPGDLVVEVPDAGVVFAADILFVDATPVMWVGPVEGWIAALDTLLALEADTFVPGHGPVTDRAGVQAVRDYWTWLREIVVREHAAGRSPLDAARAAARDDEFGRFGAWVRPERMLISVTTIHHALSGKGPIGHSPIVRGKLFADVAKLGRELETGVMRKTGL
ncbi:MAG: MBL fold metallo-hydrolase [Solirubrobacteraceae bacterium]|nr:MBL fold metallo-hydrolase [Solirubrobacteraceae bacterium]